MRSCIHLQVSKLYKQTKRILSVRPSTIKLKINYLFVYLHRQQGDYKFLLLCIQCYPETGAIQCIHCANKGNNSFHVKKEILLERLCSKTRRRQPTEKKMTTRRITYSNTIEYHHRFQEPPLKVLAVKWLKELMNSSPLNY